MTPLEKYLEDLKRSDFFSDPAQRQAIDRLQTLYEQLVVARNTESRGFLEHLKKRMGKKPPSSIRGVYFYGGVGRGKTYLMDSFYDTLPFENKLRLHFHRFMQKVHEDLTARQGEKNPLVGIAKSIAESACVICFDEFFVKDITDAMILGGLFEQLFKEGVVLVATSNIIPDRLYENGLQRQRFLPAIAALKANCDVINVDSGEDYRLRALKQASLYHYPLNDAANKSLCGSWDALAPEAYGSQASIEINHREIVAHRLSQGIAWFDFATLCDGPRSQNDYIELSRLFNTVILSGIPVFDRSMEDQARRFINLIDEFYDSQVNLIVSAAAPIDALYQGQQLAFEIERTQSRLLEMQSEEYLSKPHRP